MEPDFSAYHINMLYNITGNKMPEGDQYELDGYSKTKPIRDFLKRLLLIILNSKASTIEEARTKVKRRIHYETKYKKKLYQPEEIKDLDDLINCFIKKHKPIEEYLFSGFGNKLQYFDSVIAEEILLRFAKQSIACLPVHDSFIIDFRYATNLQLIMAEIYKREYGVFIDIKVDQADFYSYLTEIIGTIVEDSFFVGNDDPLKKQFEALNKDFSMLPDRAIIFPRD
jgi:hypothetical protein